MADAVKIPINLEVTDLDMSKLNPKELEQGMKKNLEGVRKAFTDVMKAIDTTHVSKEFSKAASGINSSFRNAESAVKGLSKSVSDLDKGTTTMKGVEKAAEDVVSALKQITDEYSGFASSANTEMALTPQFRNGLTVIQDMMREMKAYTSWTEKASENSGTTSEYWEQLETYTKASKTNIQSMLADLREMVKSGEAFKLGKNDDLYDQYMHMLKSIQGSAQSGFNRANFLFGGSGSAASSDLIEARTEVDRLAHALDLARMNLETMMRGESTTNPQIEAMQEEVKNITAQLAEAETRYQALYESAYGVAEATQAAATATVELETATTDTAENVHVAEASAIDYSDTLQKILAVSIGIREAMQSVGATTTQTTEVASNGIEKVKNKSQALNETLKASRNISTAMIFTFNQLGSVGSIIAQLIGIVQLLADAFRDVSTAVHSIIPLIGLFVGLAINIVGRLISVLKKVWQLFKKIALAAAEVAKKIGGAMVSGVKKLAGIFKSLIPSLSSIRKILRKVTQYFLGFRSAYFLIRKIRQAVIDGMKDIAANAPEVNEYMSNFSTALNQVKGSLTAAFEPVMSVVIPVLTRLMQVLAQVLTYIAKFNAVLVGRDYYYDYAAAMQDYASGIGAAGKAAKKAQKDLMGFDEINRLSAPNEPSGGGGSGLGGTFTRSEIDMENAISKFAEMVKEAWKKSDFTEVGNFIGEKFNDILEAWNSSKTQTKVRKVAQTIATDFATLINGFVETEDLGENLGKSIANLFNTAFSFLYQFANEVHWDSVGTFIGDGIAGALANFKWDSFFMTIASFVNGLSNMIINAVEGHNWWEIGAGIGNGLMDGIKMFDAASAGKAVHDFFDAIAKLIGGFAAKMGEEDWYLEAVTGYGPNGREEKWVKKSGWTVLGQKINQFFKEALTKDLGSDMGSVMGSLLSGLIDSITAADFGDAASQFFSGFIDALDKSDVLTAMGELWKTYKPKILQAIDVIGPGLKDVIYAIWKWIKDPITDIATQIGKAVKDGIEEGVSDIWDTIKTVGDELGGMAYEFIQGDEDRQNVKAADERTRKEAWKYFNKKDLSDEEVFAVRQNSQYSTLSDVTKQVWEEYEDARRHGITDMTDYDMFKEMSNNIDISFNAARRSLKGYTSEADEMAHKLAPTFVDTAKRMKEMGDQTQKSSQQTCTAAQSAAEKGKKANEQTQQSNKDTTKVVQQSAQTQQQAYTQTSATAGESSKSIVNGFANIQNSSDTAFGSIEPAAADAYTGMVSEFDGAAGYFENLWDTVVSGFQVDGAVTQGLAIGMGIVMNTAANKLIDAINTYAMTPLIRLEGMLDRLRSVTFGGATPFAGIPKLGFARIPRLARGAVLPPNQPFLSIVGDQKRGTNIEAPLETIQQAVANVMGDNTEAILAMGEAIVRAIQNKDMSVRIGDKDIYNANRAYEQRINLMRGV